MNDLNDARAKKEFRGWVSAILGAIFLILLITSIVLGTQKKPAEFAIAGTVLTGLGTVCAIALYTEAAQEVKRLTPKTEEKFVKSKEDDKNNTISQEIHPAADQPRPVMSSKSLSQSTAHQFTIKQKYYCFLAASVVFSVLTLGAALLCFLIKDPVFTDLIPMIIVGCISFFVAVYSAISANQCYWKIKGKNGNVQYSESALDFMQTELLNVIADIQKKRDEEISEIIQNLQDKNELLLKQNAENVVGSEALIGSIQLELSKSRDDYRSQQTAYNLMIKELRDKNAALEEDLKNAKAEQWKYRSLYEYNRDGRKTDVLAMRDLLNVSSNETVKKIYETMPIRFASPEKWRENYLRLFLTYGVDLMKDKETIRKQISEIDHFAFEDFVRDLFRALTYDAETTQRSGDFGADVIAKRDDVVIVIQCKHTSVLKGTLPFNAVQEIFMAKANYNADKAMIVTNSRATKQASASAQNLHVSIWDFDVLYEKLKSVVNV